MIGFVFFVLTFVSPFNVTKGKSYSLACPLGQLDCYPDCKYISITLTKDSQLSGSTPEKVYEWVQVKVDESTRQVIEEPENGRYYFHASKKAIFVKQSELDDEGLYTCEVNVLKANKYEVTTNVVIIVAPEFLGIVPLSNYILAEADNKYVDAVRCKVDAGKPVATVTWVGSDGSPLPASQFDQEIKNIGQGKITNTLRVKPVKELNRLSVFCRISHQLAIFKPTESQFTFNMTYAPTDIKIYRTGEDGLVCTVDANPPARIIWELSGPDNFRTTENQNVIKIRDAQNANFTYKCSASNRFGSQSIKTTNRDINNIKKLKNNYNIMMWSIIGTVGGLLVISISVCRYAFKSTEKAQSLPPWSEPVPIQPVDHGSYPYRPSPPRSKPPDYSESDSNSGGEIDMLESNDASFIRSDSILQRPANGRHTGGSDIFPAYRNSFKCHSDYIPGNSFARSATRDFDISSNCELGSHRYNYVQKLDQPSQIV